MRIGMEMNKTSSSSARSIRWENNRKWRLKRDTDRISDSWRIETEVSSAERNMPNYCTRHHSSNIGNNKDSLETSENIDTTILICE